MDLLKAPYLAIVLLFSVFISGNAVASLSSPGQGVIHFFGQVQESACVVTSDNNNIRMGCYRDGQHRTTLSGYSQANVGRDFAYTSISYQRLNARETAVLMIVSYP